MAMLHEHNARRRGRTTTHLEHEPAAKVHTAHFGAPIVEAGGDGERLGEERQSEHGAKESHGGGEGRTPGGRLM